MLVAEVYPRGFGLVASTVVFSGGAARCLSLALLVLPRWWGSLVEGVWGQSRGLCNRLSHRVCRGVLLLRYYHRPMFEFHIQGRQICRVRRVCRGVLLLRYWAFGLECWCLGLGLVLGSGLGPWLGF